MRKKARRPGPGQRSLRDEPVAEGDDWVEWGGELMLTEGFTAGGAPYGTTVEEFRRINAKWETRAGWARAKSVLRTTLERIGADDPEREIGWVRFLGAGIRYEAYTAECGVRLEDGWHDGLLVVRLPGREPCPDQPARAARESAFLRHLGRRDLPIRVPAMVATVPVENGTALVQTFVEGIPLETRASRNRVCKPWEVTGRVAAVCHAVETEPLADLLECHPTRRSHALARMRVLEEADLPGFAEARAWAASHLPGEEPGCLLHGDLLGQNLRIDPLGKETVGVIDWAEARIGDPAYDLAIVTRGRRKPFQTDNGKRRLLDAYNANARYPVRESDVTFHELCMHASWCADESSRDPDSGEADQAMRNFASLLRRL